MLGPIYKGAAAAGGAVKPDAARVRAWRLRGRQGVHRDEHNMRWKVYIHYGEQLHLGNFKTKEDAIACRLLAEDRIDAGCHPQTGKYVPKAERPKPPKTQLKNNTHLLGNMASRRRSSATRRWASARPTSLPRWTPARSTSTRWPACTGMSG